MAKRTSAMQDGETGEHREQQLPEEPVHSIAPPGVVRGAGHGRAQPLQTPYGVAHLRHLLELSPEVPVEQVAEEAAWLIEKLRSAGEPKRR